MLPFRRSPWSPAWACASVLSLPARRQGRLWSTVLVNKTMPLSSFAWPSHKKSTQRYNLANCHPLSLKISSILEVHALLFLLSDNTSLNRPVVHVLVLAEVGRDLSHLRVELDILLLLLAFKSGYMSASKNLPNINSNERQNEITNALLWTYYSDSQKI